MRPHPSDLMPTGVLPRAVLAALLLLAPEARAGKARAKDDISVTVNGDEVVVIKDGKRIESPKIVERNGQRLILGDDGETVILTIPDPGALPWARAGLFGRKGLRIGVWLEPVGGALAAQLGLEPGAGLVVTRVEEGGPADEGGVEQYDIVTKVAGKPVDQPNAIRSALEDLAEGDHLQITVTRGGKEHSLDLVPEMGDLGAVWPFGATADLPGVTFMPGGDGDIAVIAPRPTTRALEETLEAYAEAQKGLGHREAEELEARLEEMEARLKEMEARLHEGQ